jgi:glycosyltransferase involved in cell wall biosynthesis
MSDVISSQFHGSIHVDVVRNPANLGLSGNILRCMETASTEWLWILADDDVLAPDAVSSILLRTQQEPDSDFFMFGQAPGHSESAASKGIGAFAESLDDWRRITFISAGVYRAASAVKLLGVGINYAYTVVPFIAIILQGIQEHGWKVGFDKKVLVTPTHKAESTWSWVWSINTYIVLELIEEKRARNKLARLASNWCLGPVGLAHDLATRRLSNKPGLSNLAYHHKRLLISWGGWKQRILLGLTSWWHLIPPTMMLSMINLIRKCARRQDRGKRSGEAVFGQA